MRSGQSVYVKRHATLSSIAPVRTKAVCYVLLNPIIYLNKQVNPIS
uniref:Uncharacterized protein n=1 Tax=Arundo donax TaxID=35708 RepID=A0A0A9EIC0_ARUDO